MKADQKVATNMGCDIDKKGDADYLLIFLKDKPSYLWKKNKIVTSFLIWTQTTFSVFIA